MQCTVGKVRIIEMIEIIGRETTGNSFILPQGRTG